MHRYACSCPIVLDFLPTLPFSFRVAFFTDLILQICRTVKYSGVRNKGRKEELLQLSSRDKFISALGLIQQCIILTGVPRFAVAKFHSAAACEDLSSR